MGHEGSASPASIRQPASHRAAGRARGPFARAAVGRRPSPAGLVRRVLPPAAVLGLVAATVAATGSGASEAPPRAEMVSSYAAVASQALSTPAASASSASAVSATAMPVTEAVLLDRGLPVSRDSERQALGQSANMETKPASSGVAKQENAALAKLAQEAQGVADRTPQNSWKLPVQNYRISATFGQGSNLWANRHTGLDFAAPTGTVVSSVTPGRVISAAYAGAYGERIVIRTPEGTEVYYCHLSAYAVQAGDTVTAGQTIGKVGSTGNSTGPHLHLEVRPGGGDPVDPFAALVQRGVRP